MSSRTFSSTDSETNNRTAWGQVTIGNEGVSRHLRKDTTTSPNTSESTKTQSGTKKKNSSPMRLAQALNKTFLEDQSQTTLTLSSLGVLLTHNCVEGSLVFAPDPNLPSLQQLSFHATATTELSKSAKRRASRLSTFTKESLEITKDTHQGRTKSLCSLRHTNQGCSFCCWKHAGGKCPFLYLPVYSFGGNRNCFPGFQQRRALEHLSTPVKKPHKIHFEKTNPCSTADNFSHKPQF